MRNIHDHISKARLFPFPGNRLLYSLRDFNEQIRLSNEQAKFVYDALDAVWAYCDFARHPEYTLQNDEEPV